MLRPCTSVCWFFSTKMLDGIISGLLRHPKIYPWQAFFCWRTTIGTMRKEPNFFMNWVEKQIPHKLLMILNLWIWVYDSNINILCRKRILWFNVFCRIWIVCRIICVSLPTQKQHFGAFHNPEHPLEIISLPNRGCSVMKSFILDLYRESNIPGSRNDASPNPHATHPTNLMFIFVSIILRCWPNT